MIQATINQMHLMAVVHGTCHSVPLIIFLSALCTILKLNADVQSKHTWLLISIRIINEDLCSALPILCCRVYAGWRILAALTGSYSSPLFFMVFSREISYLSSSSSVFEGKIQICSGPCGHPSICIYFGS